MGYTVYLVLFYYQGSIKDSRVLLRHLAIAVLFAKFCLMLLEASQFFTYEDIVVVIVVIFINIKNSIIVIIIILVIVIIWINIIYKTIPICIFVIFIIIIVIIIIKYSCWFFKSRYLFHFWFFSLFSCLDRTETNGQNCQ